MRCFGHSFEIIYSYTVNYNHMGYNSNWYTPRFCRSRWSEVCLCIALLCRHYIHMMQADTLNHH